MDWWLASFFLGAILSLFLPIVPEFSVLLLLISISLAFFYYSFKLNKPLRASSGLLLGASWMLFNALSLQQVWQENQLDALKLASKTQWLQGQVLSLYSPIKKRVETAHQQQVIAQRLRFNFKVTHLNNQKLETALKLRLSWKQAAFPLQQGQTAQLKVKLKPAHGLANLGGFSYQTWLNSSGISGTGYVVNDKNNQLLSAEKSIRQALFNRYKNHLPNHPLAPLLLALGFGSRSDLSPEVWQVLQATGTGHLIAISGLHIGLVATASYFLITLFIRCFPLSFFF